MKDLQKSDPKFPNSMVPGAKNIDDVMDAWKEAGLTPVEVSEEDMTTEILITAKKHNGELQWEVKKADGIRALSIMAVTMKSMFEEYLKDGGRPKLSSETPNTKIAIQLENGEVKMAYDQTIDPMAVKGLLQACLWKMIDQIGESGGHPLRIFNGNLEFTIPQN